jgi:hypothetical protein
MICPFEVKQLPRHSSRFCHIRGFPIDRREMQKDDRPMGRMCKSLSGFMTRSSLSAVTMTRLIDIDWARQMIREIKVKPGRRWIDSRSESLGTLKQTGKVQDQSERLAGFLAHLQCQSCNDTSHERLEFHQLKTNRIAQPRSALANLRFILSQRIHQSWFSWSNH